MEALKSQVQKYWDTEPCGWRYSTGAAPPGSADEIERARYALEPHIPGFAGFAQGRNQRVLEIGVGVGTDFLNWVRHGAAAVGLELSPVSATIARQRLLQQGLRAPLVVADAEDLPFADGCFDIVYSYGVWHHSPDTERAIREAHRVLRAGGTCRAMLYHLPSWTGWLLWLRYALLGFRPLASVRRILSEHLESPGTKAFSLSECARLFAGFRRTEMSTRLGPGDLLLHKPGPRYQGRLYRWAFKLYPRPLLRALGHRFGVLLLITAEK